MVIGIREQENNLIRNLQDGIRRYCIDNHLRWSKEYSDLARDGKNRLGYGYTDEALNIFPRYVFLEKTLFEIERSIPEDFATLDDAKSFFLLILAETHRASDIASGSPVESLAIREEFVAISKYVENLSENDLLLVEPLFYRRVLSEEQSNSIRQELNSRWGIDKQYWYPLTLDKPDNTEAFQDSYFEKEVGVEKVRNLLASHGVKNIYEMREYGANYHLELAVFEPYYNGAEGYWCDDNFDWIFYASHESSITVSGWILKEIQSLWPNWKDRVWTTPFFE